MFGAVDEPLAPCMVTHVWVYGFEMTVGVSVWYSEEDFSIDFFIHVIYALYLCFVHYSSLVFFRQTFFFWNNILYNKYFVLSYSIDVVSTHPYEIFIWL